jgi:hypothetical protein
MFKGVLHTRKMEYLLLIGCYSLNMLRRRNQNFFVIKHFDFSIPVSL